MNLIILKNVFVYFFEITYIIINFIQLNDLNLFSIKSIFNQYLKIIHCKKYVKQLNEECYYKFLIKTKSCNNKKIYFLINFIIIII